MQQYFRKRFHGNSGGTGDTHTQVAQEYFEEHNEENGPQDLSVNDYDKVESQEQFHMDHGLKIQRKKHHHGQDEP